MAEPKFEEALAKLEEITRQLESGDLSLEKSLALFEEGVKWVKFCQKRLHEAEKKIQILVKDKEGRLQEEDFKLEAENKENKKED